MQAPVEELQESSVQLFPSLQILAVCLQRPAPSQISVVQALPSEVQAVPAALLVIMHWEAAMLPEEQAAVWQGFVLMQVAAEQKAFASGV